jgi:pyruvate/2-oxoglutarate dehydrogenase complex dihydrolipoamide dehydrogenase (E3) component
VDENYRTSSEIGNIYAVGDVAGGGLASVAQYQARRVAEYLFKDLRERSGAIKADNEPRFREEERTGNQVEPAEDEDSDVDSFEVDDFFITDSGKDVTTAAMLNGELSEVPPLTLWTIPEIASVGLSNEQAAELYGAEHCVTGYGYFKDLARGRLNGETQGMPMLLLEYPCLV